jgi:hypothetical protein
MIDKLPLKISPKEAIFTRIPERYANWVSEWLLHLSHKRVNKVKQTGVYVHLDNTVVNGSLDFLLGRARATMEDEETRKTSRSDNTRGAF